MSERDASNPDELRLELEGLRAENRRLRSLLGLDTPERATAVPAPPHAWEPTLFPDPLASTDRVPVDGHSSPEAKVALFRSLFAGRDDVDAARWENERSGKSGWSPVVVGGPARSRRPVVRIHDPAAERRRGAPHRSDARRPVPRCCATTDAGSSDRHEPGFAFLEPRGVERESIQLADRVRGSRYGRIWKLPPSLGAQPRREPGRGRLGQGVKA